MPRRLQDNELDTAAARKRLRPRDDPYWRRVSRCCHLGYRRNRHQAGRWVCRFYDGSRYIKKAIGSADDTEMADGVRSLSFDQAVARAQEWFGKQAQEAEGVSDAPAKYTIRNCLEDYLDWYRAHRKGIQQVTYSVNAHILPILGPLEVKRLTARRLRKWHENLACSPARLRTRGGEPPGSREATTLEERRKRKATANRVLSIFEAALNRAFHEGFISSDESWRRVKPFR